MNDSEKLDLILNRLNDIEKQLKELDDDIIEDQSISKQFGLNLLANLTADYLFTSVPYQNLKSNLSPFHTNNIK